MAHDDFSEKYALHNGDNYLAPTELSVTPHTTLHHNALI
jgi:hypothetical protein